MNNNLAGVLIWSIESDDWNNDCGGGYWPLLNAIDSTMNGGQIQPVNPPQTITQPPTPAPITVTPPPPTSAPAQSSGTCSAAGYFATPGTCATFYECVENG